MLKTSKQNTTSVKAKWNSEKCSVNFLEGSTGKAEKTETRKQNEQIKP